MQTTATSTSAYSNPLSLPPCPPRLPPFSLPIPSPPSPSLPTNTSVLLLPLLPLPDPSIQLTDLEKQFAQSATDARDAQKERDVAIKQSHASQRQLDSQAQDVHKYKSAVRCFFFPLARDFLNSRTQLMQAELTVGSVLPPCSTLSGRV